MGDDERELFAIWNWLPAFHVVAQTQHLPSALARLHVGASALSRAIKQIEDRVGFQLFDREGGRLELSERGRAWHETLAQAIDRLRHDLGRMHDAATTSTLQIGAGAVSQALVLPALAALRESHPHIVPTLHASSDREALALLEAGRFDYVLLPSPRTNGRSTIERIGELEHGVFCSRDHALAAGATRDAILADPFVEIVRDGTPGPWPVDVPRRVAMYVNHEDTALQLCLGGQMLAVLPELVAARYVESEQLVRLRPVALLPTTLYAARAARSARDDRLDAFTAALRDHIARRDPTDPSPWRLGDQLVRRAEYAAALRAYRVAFAASPRGPDVAADYQLRLARVALHLGRYRVLHAACDRARRAARRHPVRLAGIEALRALGHCYAGELGPAERTIAAARRQLARAHDGDRCELAATRAAVCRSAGNVLVARGDLAGAAAELERGAAECVRIDDRWEHSIALFNLADAQLAAGDRDGAAATLERAAVEKAAIGDRWGTSYVEHTRARIHLARGEPELALRCAAAGLELAFGFADRKLVAMLDLVIGRAHLALGDDASAERAFGFALTAARRARARFEIVEALVCLSELALRRGDRRAAAQHARSAIRHARATDSQALLAAGHRALAAVHRYGLP